MTDDPNKSGAMPSDLIDELQKILDDSKNIEAPTHLSREERRAFLCGKARQAEIDMQDVDGAIANSAIISLDGLTSDEVLESLISNNNREQFE